MKRYLNKDYENIKEFYATVKYTAQYKDSLPMPTEDGHTNIDSSTVLQAYNDSKVFNIAPEIALALEKTNYNSADQEMMAMPFKSLFLNINTDYHGKMLDPETIEDRIGETYEDYYHTQEKDYIIQGVLILKVNRYEEHNDLDEDSILILSMLYDKEADKHRDLYQVTGVGYEDWDEPETAEQYIGSIVNNFLLFLNQKEVNYRTKERGRKNRERRRNKGKTPLPDDGIVEVKGEIERYLEKMADTDIVHTHRYWVRGHWRTLRDEERYGDNAGEKVWVKPHTRGGGLLVDKDYEVQNDGDDN